jgi:hypothetical protein
MFKLKVATNEDNYKEIVLKRAINLCWFLLFVCFIIKIFGGNFFNIVCENENFIKLCNYIDSTWLYYLVGYINYMFTSIIFTFAICSTVKLKRNNIFICIISLTIFFMLKVVNRYFGLIVDYLIYIPIICHYFCMKEGYSFKQSIIRTFLGLLLVNIFQLISLFIRNLGTFSIIKDNTLNQLIMNIDYVILLILYLLYSIKIKLKKEVV